MGWEVCDPEDVAGLLGEFAESFFAVLEGAGGAEAVDFGACAGGENAKHVDLRGIGFEGNVTDDTEDTEWFAVGIPEPARGWLSREEVDRVNQQMVEAIAAENWIDGAIFAVRLLRAFGG